jgi:hypothetical protein
MRGAEIMIVAGIDPGKRGAIVAIDSKSDKAWYRKLTYNSMGILTNDLRLFDSVEIFIIEHVRGRGGWGASQVFAMGSYFGQILKTIHDSGKPYVLVEPRIWTALMYRDIDAKSYKGKERNKAAYIDFCPHDPIGLSKCGKGHHDGVIDAMLIAMYHLAQSESKIRKWKFQ